MGTLHELTLSFPGFSPAVCGLFRGVCVFFCPRSRPADNVIFLLFPIVSMVLPVGIEPTTSPLPRGCSTTELRQRLGLRPVPPEIHDAPVIGKAGGWSCMANPTHSLVAGVAAGQRRVEM